MKWLDEKQKRLEWKIAYQDLKKENGELAESGTKIKRGRYSDKETNSTAILTHSFVTFANKIYAIGAHTDYIKKENKSNLSKANIKYAMDESDHKYGLKIQITNRAHLDEITSENRIAVDLSVALPGGYRQIAEDRWKCYSPYFYFSRGTLHNLIQVHRANIQMDMAYQLAFNVARMVHHLHSGQSSQSGIKYAHLDIKPDNIVLDNAFKLRFIDLGYADVLEGQASHFRGTPGYLPLHPLNYTKQNLDIFALLRILHLPKMFQVQRSSNPAHPIKLDTRHLKDSWIFPDRFVSNTPRLQALLAITNNKDLLSTLSALDVMRELTLSRCNLDDSFQDYLITEAAINAANRLFSQHITIYKEYLAPNIIDKINSSDAIINEQDLLKFISDAEAEEALSKEEILLPALDTPQKLTENGANGASGASLVKPEEHSSSQLNFFARPKITRAPKTPRPQKTLVNMYEMKFSKEEHVSLYTEGVCTCIAFAINGFYIPKTKSKTSKIQFFCGLYHWAGFTEGIEGEEQFHHASDALLKFFDRLRHELKIKTDLPLVVTKLHFIGGEHPQTTHRGTEQEVTALQDALKAIDFEEELISFKENAIHHSHYLTSDEQSLTINVSTTEISYSLNDEPSPLPAVEEISRDSLTI